MASEAAQQRTSANSPNTRNRGCGLQRLPTIQIDTVPSPPPSPVELTPPDESDEFEEPIDESEIHLDLETVEQDSDNSSEDLKDFLKLYVDDILSQAMVLAEKKLQFAGLPEEDEEEDEQPEPVESSPEPTREPEKEIDDSEIRATAEKVVQEVLEKASETAAEKLEKSLADLSFPDLPSIQIDTVKSAPPSPESEEETPCPQKKWTFTMQEDTESEKNIEVEEEAQTPDLPSIQIDTVKSAPPSPESEEETPCPQKKWTFTMQEDSESEKNIEVEEEKPALIKFDDAPEDVKEAATSFVKEIVGKAVAMAEEKSVPTVPFNFEDVELMKTSGPWYIRAREALIRLLRTACFCTPRRSDS